jgi:small subunit ribosomal protein S6
MGKYELLYIIPAKYTDPEVASLVEKIKGIVTGAGATVTETHDLGKRKLAYPINHVRNGNYVLTYFESAPDVMAKLNETLRLSVDILRHMIVTRDPYLKNIPSLVEVEERRGEDGEIDRRPRERAPLVQVKAPGVPKDQMSMAELDKKLDAILTEEVV